MTRILDLFIGQKQKPDCRVYQDHLSLFTALKNEEKTAICCLFSKVSGTIFKIGKDYGLTDEDIEELICDCITLIIIKIKNGEYAFQGYDPASFVIEIAKNKVRNMRRIALRHETADIDLTTELADDTNLGSKEDVEILDKLMTMLDPNCQKLIKLKYLEEYRDKDVIELKLTQYTTVDALKTHRSKCMKKLVELGSNYSH